jgi:hypothetical protein
MFKMGGYREPENTETKKAFSLSNIPRFKKSVACSHYVQVLSVLNESTFCCFIDCVVLTAGLLDWFAGCKLQVFRLWQKLGKTVPGRESRCDLWLTAAINEKLRTRPFDLYYSLVSKYL